MDQPQAQTPVTPRKLPGFTQLLQRAWTAYRANALVLSGLALLPALLFLILGAGTFNGSLPFGGPSQPTEAFDFLTSGFAGRFIFSLLLTLAAFLLAIWSQASLLYAITHDETRGNIRAAARGGWHLMWPVFWTSFLYGIAVGLGLLLLIVPGIYLWIAMSFGMIIVVAEKITGIDALKRSMFYVKGYWFSVFWRLLVFTLAWNVFTFLIGVIFGEAASYITAILGIVETPLLLLYTYQLYRELKQIKGAA